MISHTRKQALGLTAALATAGLTATTVGLTAPAQAAGDSLDYTCTVPVLGTQTFTVVNSSNAPATLRVGQARKIKLTSKVTIPATLGNALYAVGGRTADGTAVAEGTLGRKATTSTLKVPTTDVPAEGDLTVTATGKGGTFKAKRPGRFTLTAGDFTSTLNVYDANGVPLSGLVSSPVTVPCTAPDGVNTTFDKITVKKDTTKTRVKVKKVKKGKKATARITVTSTHGTTAKGKVRVLIKKGKKTIEKKVARLKHGKVTVHLPKRLKKKGKYTAIAKYTGSKLLLKSTGKRPFRVR